MWRRKLADDPSLVKKINTDHANAKLYIQQQQFLDAMPASFESLPPEVLSIIFKYLVAIYPYSDRIRVGYTMVSRSWFDHLAPSLYKRIANHTVAEAALINSCPKVFGRIYGRFVRTVDVGGTSRCSRNTVLKKLVLWDTWSNIWQLKVGVIKGDDFNTWIMRLITSDKNNITKLCVSWVTSTEKTPNFIHLLEDGGGYEKKVRLNSLDLYRTPEGFLSIYNTLKTPKLQANEIIIRSCIKPYQFKPCHFRRLKNIGLLYSLDVPMELGISVNPGDTVINNMFQELKGFAGVPAFIGRAGLSKEMASRSMGKYLAGAKKLEFLNLEIGEACLEFFEGLSCNGSISNYAHLTTLKLRLNRYSLETNGNINQALNYIRLFVENTPQLKSLHLGLHTLCFEIPIFYKNLWIFSPILLENKTLPNVSISADGYNFSHQLVILGMAMPKLKQLTLRSTIITPTVKKLVKERLKSGMEFFPRLKSLEISKIYPYDSINEPYVCFIQFLHTYGINLDESSNSFLRRQCCMECRASCRNNV